MGTIYAAFVIENAEDQILAKRNLLQPKEIHNMYVDTLVNTSAFALTINESIEV